jgi:hypothetical protein
MTTHAVRGRNVESGATERAESRMARPRAHTAPAVREALVARAKRLLAQGYYDNTHVLEFAVARMLEDPTFGRTTPKLARGASPGRQAREARAEASAELPRRVSA